MATSIITPNYDVCLESSMLATKVSNDFQYARIVTESDSQSVDPHSKCIFKIHGSADGAPQDLVFTMKQEGRLPPWKRDLLRHLIEGKHLLIIGYSGYDFDICPELIAAGPKAIVWNFLSKHDADNSINAQQIARQIQTHFLYGDMTDLLSAFLPVKPKKDASYIASIEYLKDIFKSQVDSPHLRLWQIRIYNTLNCNGTVLGNVDKSLDEDKNLVTELNREKAIALVNSGRYRQGSASYIRTAIETQDQDEKDLLLSLAEHSWLASGAYFKYLYSSKRRSHASTYKRETTRCSDNTQDSHNFIQLLSYIYKFNIPFISKWMRRLARKQIVSTGERYHCEGDWYGISRLQILAAETNLLGEMQILGAYKLPAIEKAYHQLGFPIGEMMAFRKSLEDSIGISKQRITLDEGDRLLAIALTLNIYPEVWKLSYALDNRFPISDHVEQFWIGLNHCEYSILRRMSIISKFYYARHKSIWTGAKSKMTAKGTVL